jgi:hypothetical protein
MDDNRSVAPAPTWFSVAAIGALLWEMLGCALLVMHAITDPVTLPRDQQAIWQATPSWMNFAWGFAVVSGLAGAILLLTRKRRAEPLLLLSLVAVAVQFSGMLLVPALRELIASDDLLAPFLVLLVCYGIWMLARRGRNEGWLR